MRRLLLVSVLAWALVLGACGGGDADGALPDGAFAVRASSDLGLGPERLLIGIVGPEGERLGSPDLGVTLQLFPQSDPSAVEEVEADFLWIVPDSTGIYKADVVFGQPGPWAAILVPEGGEPLEPVGFEVLTDTFSPGVGEPAPASDSPTSATNAIEDISTDNEPDPRFYEMTVAEAVTSGQPSVIVFATPQFCQTSACGPMLEDVKTIAAGYPDVNFVHVEVFTGFNEPGFAPDGAHLAPAVVEWGLTTEPWVFVVDARGVVTHRFEGVMDPTELEAALG